MSTPQPDIAEELGSRLRRIREAQILTQVELARKLRIPVRSLQDYEAGRALPQAARRRRIIGLLERSGL